jgi:hypothetical protein
MPGGYRDINMNVRFEGMICEIQVHTAGHYALKGEQHTCYELCRSVGLVGDIEGFDQNGTIANNGPSNSREGAMAFDVACDFVYTVGVNWACFLHAFAVDAIVPVDIVSHLSLWSPCLRVLSVVRTVEKASWTTSGNVDPSRLPRKAAMGFGLLSLAGFVLALVAADHDVYPWNINACRSCQCSDELVLEHCNYEGQSLVLARRGITGIKAGALDGAPDVKKLIPHINNSKMLPTSAVYDALGLELVSVSHTTIEFLEAGALRNLTRLADLSLGNNFLSSSEEFNGTLSDLPSSCKLYVEENDVTCEDLHFGKETWECFD